MSAIAIDDVTYNHYYRPNGLINNENNDEWIKRLWDWADKNNIQENRYYELFEVDSPRLGGWHFIFTFSADLTEKYTILNSDNVKDFFELIESITRDNNGWIGGEIPSPYDLNIGISRNKEKLLNSEILDLSENNLTYLPDEIINLQNLEYLNLRDNNFTSLPDEIGDLSKLKVLCCNGDLKALPESIITLTNLEELHLYCKLLVLTAEQKQWIAELQENGCIIEMYS